MACIKFIVERLIWGRGEGEGPKAALVISVVSVVATKRLHCLE